MRERSGVATPSRYRELEGVATPDYIRHARMMMEVNVNRSGKESEASDSDEAPEALSLSRGREQALESRRMASTEARRANLFLKEQRKKRERLFTEQKIAKEKRKCDTVTRFPVTDLKRLLEIEDQALNSSQPASLPRDTETKARRKRRKTKKSPTENECGSVKVVALEGSPEGSCTVAAGREAALNFVWQQLYENPRIKRVPALSFEAQKYRNRPPANFV